MRRMVVRDARGVRWSVRTRRLRSGHTSHPRSRPEEESLHRRLAAVFAPHPAVVPDPLRGGGGAWWTPGDASDIAIRETRAEFADHREHGSTLWALAHALRMIRDAVEHLRTPWTDTWRLEVAATGRIRRWACWEVDGEDATEQARATVAAALPAGDVPRPRGASLVEVVDQRPPTSRRRSAGLGRAA